MSYEARQRKRELKTHGTLRAGLVLADDTDLDVQRILTQMELLNPSRSLPHDPRATYRHQLRLEALENECYDSPGGYNIEKSLKNPEDIKTSLKELGIDAMFKRL